jgi:hypothetical protein
VTADISGTRTLRLTPVDSTRESNPTLSTNIAAHSTVGIAAVNPAVLGIKPTAIIWDATAHTNIIITPGENPATIFTPWFGTNDNFTFRRRWYS